MAEFSSGVTPPGGASYSAPLLSFAAFSRWKPDDPYAQVFKQQQEELNAQRLQAMQRQNALGNAFPNGLPTDANGQIDYRKLANVLASKGDFGDATKVLANSPAPLDPLLRGAPAATGGAQPAANATAAKIIEAESGGNPNAKNPNSSAAGLGQFTDSTWIDAVKRYFPNLAKGRSDDQILKMRAIPQLATRVTEAFTAGNEDGLQRAGLPVTPATAYLAHFAGLEGATKVLRADPNTPVSQILGSAAIKANPFLKDMTARDLERWAARKMQGPAMVAQQGQGGNVQTADASPDLLPPSVNAVSPRASSTPAGAGGGTAGVAPAPSAVPSPAPAGAGAPQPQPMAQVQPSAGPAPQPQPAPSQPQQPHPIGAVEPLPEGFTDPQKAINALREAANRHALSPNRFDQLQAKRLDAWANRIESNMKPIAAPFGRPLLNPRTGQVEYNADQPTLSPGALEAGAWQYFESGKLPTGLGYGAQRAANIGAMMDRAEQLAAEHNIKPEDLPARWIQFNAQSAGQRMLSQRGTNLTLAENEASTLIPRVRELSAKIDRTRFPTINSLILAAQKHAGGQNVIRLGIAVASLIPVYARVLKPTGQITEGDTTRARDILDQAWSNGQIDAALDQMQVEMTAARSALGKTVTESRDMSGQGATKSAAPKVQGTTSSGLKWSVE